MILAGGKSSRMGRPKALLPFGGEPLIVHTVRSLATRFADIVVVAAPGQDLPQLPVTLVHDTVAYQGPVGGISYGLQAARREVCFVTSCDAPFSESGAGGVAGFTQRRLRCCGSGVAGRACNPCTPSTDAACFPGCKPSLRVASYDRLPCTTRFGPGGVDPQEIRQLDPQGHSFRNLNSPEDYQAALELWPSLHGGVRWYG